MNPGMMMSVTTEPLPDRPEMTYARENLRRLVPWVKRPPSEYIREHVRVTVQPLDAPRDVQSLLQVIDQLGSEDMLLYASDYPHQHAAEPESALLRHLPAPLAQKIRGDNARAWYRL